MTQSPKKKIAVLTSGGDAPGMNSCLRAIVRRAIHQNCEVLGIRNGYEGLIRGDAKELNLRSVGNIIQRGGTFLKSSRSKEFREESGRKKAADFLKSQNIFGLITIGGDGTLTGANKLAEESGLYVIGVPCTIDNDLIGTDFAIGYDTAVNTAVQCIDKIRDTADSHGRVFVIEVMGKNTGHLAVDTALAAGAEFVVTPEKGENREALLKKIKAGVKRGKSGNIVIVAERKTPGEALAVAEAISKEVDRDVRTSLLGHLQRGGSPTSLDRNIAAQMGAYAVDTLLSGETQKMVGIECGVLKASAFAEVLGKSRKISEEKLALIDILSI